MNLFKIPAGLEPESGQEFFENLCTGSGGLLLERIISHGHSTPEGEWHDQERDEWVLVLQGEGRVAYPDGKEVTLRQGDSLFLPKRARHRVSYTSSPCIWLAVHADVLTEG